MAYPAIDSIANYGGIFADYRPPEDPSTDLAAAAFNQMSASVAAMTHLAPRAWATFLGHATAPTISNSLHDAAWGSAVGNKPAATHIGTGHYRVTWPTTVMNELGNSYAVNLRMAWVNVQGATLYHTQCVTTAANAVDIYVFNASNAANDAAGVSFDVFAI